MSSSPQPSEAAVEAARTAFQLEVVTARRMRRKDYAWQRALEAAYPTLRAQVLEEVWEAALEEARNIDRSAHSMSEPMRGYRETRAETLRDFAALLNPKEPCERCKGTRHDWEPGPTGEPISIGPCPDCFTTTEDSDAA